MKQLLFSIAFLFLAFCSHAQFRLAVNGTPSWTSLGGGLYQTTVTFHADLTGNSYAVAGIVDTMRLFTGRGQVFEVDSVWGKTFSQATLRVEYLEGVSSAPVGQSMVYNPNGSVFIPDVPFGSTGATALLNQAVVSYNAAKSGATALDTSIIATKYGQDTSAAAIRGEIAELVESITPLTDTTFIVNFVDGTKDTIIIPYQTAQEIRVSDEDDHYTGTNVEAVLAEIGTQLPENFMVDNTISATDKIHKTDSGGNNETSTAQSWFNQMRDSTLIGVATVDAIINLPTTTPEFSRILVKNTGAIYVVRDSVDFKVSDTVNDFAGTLPTSGNAWFYKNDTLAVVKLKNTTKYAFYEPVGGEIPVSHFSKTGISDNKKVQTAINYSFWSMNQYRTNTTGVKSDSVEISMSNTIVVDNDLYLTDSIYRRHGIRLVGLTSASPGRAYQPVLTFNLNNANKSCITFDEIGSTAISGGSVENLRIQAISPCLSLIKANQPNNVTIKNNVLEGTTAGGSAKNATYGILTTGTVHQKIENNHIKRVGTAIRLAVGSIVSTTFTIERGGAIECTYGIVVDSGAVYDMYVKAFSFESIDSNIIYAGRGGSITFSDIYTEGTGGYHIVQLGMPIVGGGNISGKYAFYNCGIITNTTVSAGSVINSDYTSGLLLVNSTIGGKTSALKTTANTSLVTLDNVVVKDITTNTDLAYSGLAVNVNTATKINLRQVNIASLGFGSTGLINSTNYRFEINDNESDSGRGLRMRKFSPTSGDGNYFVTDRYGGTHLSPVVIMTGANVYTHDLRAYVGTTNKLITVGRISFTGDGSTPSDSPTGFPIDMTIRLASSTVAAPSNTVATFTNGKRLGIGVSPTRALHVLLDDAATNSISYVGRVTHTSSGTPTTGFGAGFEFEQENASGTNRVAATIQTPYTDATNASEDADLVFGNIVAGTLANRMWLRDQRVGLGAAPVASAAMDINSTTAGFLIPRMTTTQRNAISSPATGLQVYNTSLNKLNFYNGSAWRSVLDSATADARFAILGGNSGAVIIGSNDNTTTIEAGGVGRYTATSSAHNFELIDNQAGALLAAESASEYFRINTLNSSEDVILGLAAGTAKTTLNSPVNRVSSGRFTAAKGADVASANDLTLGTDGNLFHITGTTQINAITTANWQAGSEIILIFDAATTVKNNTAGSGGTAVMLLLGGLDFVTTANDVLKLVFDGTSWFEVSRSVN